MNQLQPKTYANKLSWCFGIVMTLLLAGCDSGDKDPILTPDASTGLTQIVVNPANPAIPAGLSRKFEALGVYADGTSVNISERVTWTSATPAAATVNGSGNVNAISNGSAVISAAVAGKTGQTTVTVTDAALVSITLSPLAGTAVAGVNVQFSATGVYSNGTSQNLTSMVTWTSSDLTITSFNQDRMANSGLATALAAGVSTVTASMANISANTTFTVTAANLTSLVITPANPSVIAGLTQQMMVTGTYNNGSSVDLTAQAVWSSADTTLLTFNANGAADSGQATAVAAGTVAVTASFGGMTATGNVLVNQAELTALSIAPAAVTIAAGNSQQFIATGVYNNGTTANITTMVTWASSDIDVAIVNANLALDSGLVTSKIPGAVVVSASINTAKGLISNTANLTVSNAVVTSLQVTPATPLLINGFSQQLTATLLYSDQSTVDVTSTVTWSSADTSIVTMNPSGAADSGLATPVMAGSALITATVDATTAGSTLLSVVEATLQSIAITPDMPSAAVGTSQQLAATGTFSNGSTMNLTRYVVWQSANIAIATFNPNMMSNSGLLNAVMMGNTDISASFNGTTANTPLTVTAANLLSVAITPMNPAMNTGQILQMQLIGTYTDNSVADLAANAVWSSSNTSVATFNPNQQANGGLLSAIAAGSTTLQAEFTTANLQTLSSSTSLTVTGALATNPQAPQLDALTGFVMAASQGVSTTPGTIVADGDMAIIDTNRATFTGFTNGASAGLFTELTNGISYARDDTNPPYPVPLPYASSADYISEIKTNLMSVSTYLVGANPAADTTTLTDTDIGGLTLNRGVYHLTGTVLISQDHLTLNAQGDANSVFIIYINGNFSTAFPGGNVVLLNGAKASNVYWRIGGTTTIGTNSQFTGTVVSTGNIQLQTGATVQGRLISVAGNIQLDANSITKSL